MVAAGVVGWVLGFLWFIHVVQRPPPPLSEADGIVALTGGAERVEAALHLLTNGRARRLLVSGTGGGAELPALAHRAGLDPSPLSQRVTLGRAAMSTHGNALETAAWAQQYHIETLIVVTAFYHMPRALTELRRSLPRARLYPYPVLSASGMGIGRLTTLRLLAEEYCKYLIATTGLSAWAPERDLARAGHTG
jgi:uncharacterized SAM-binding protein YcdF (DUF218 family)